jgi:hypothetical protein
MIFKFPSSGKRAEIERKNADGIVILQVHFLSMGKEIE